jgi:hypothetical protein
LIELLSLGGLSLVTIGFFIYKNTKIQKESKQLQENLQQSELQIATLVERTATL